MVKKFTVKQQRFIDYYDGNATQAALKAGYSKKTAFRSGIQNMQKYAIAEAIRKREIKRSGLHIATREERQYFWTKLMEQCEKDSDRLKASELLGRSEADFVDRHEMDVGDKIEELLKRLGG